MLHKKIGFDIIKSRLYWKVFGLSEIFVIGIHAQVINLNIIDLVLIGQQLNNNQINNILKEIELSIRKKIRFIILRNNEFNKFFGHSKIFKITYLTV